MIVKPKGLTATGQTSVHPAKSGSATARTLTAQGAVAKDAPAVGQRGAANDECTAPVAVSGAVVAFPFNNTVNTTGTSGQGNAACLFFGTANINNDEWVVWTASGTGTATVSTCGATASDTKIAVWNGAACPPTAIVACNDDNCSLQSSLSFPATAGNQYLIQIGTFPGGATGSGTMTITGPAGGGGGPANDNCGSATAVGEGTFPFDTTSATQDATVSCGFNANLDVWYSYTPSQTGTATWTTCTLTTLDTVLARFDACGGTQVQCLDDACGLQTQISFPTVAGVPMLLRLAGYNNSQGSGSHTISVVGGGGGGPANDNCASATNIGDGTFAYDLTGATNDWPGTCGGTASAEDVWYRYTASCTGTATVSTCGLTSADTVLTILDECGGPQILCLDDFCGLQTQVNFAVTTGEDYFIRLADFAGGTHAAQFSVSCALPATNDNCADALAISGAGPHNFDNSAATTDGNPDPLCLSFGLDQIENDVWFTWGPATCNPGEFVEVSFCGLTGIDSRVAIYDGTSCTGPILACNDDSCGLQSRVRFAATPGNSYTIRVGTFPGAGGGTGQFTTNCVFVSPPVCTAFNPATDCQESAFLIAYNMTTFAAAEAVSANVPVNSLCIQGLYFNNAPVADSFIVTVYNDAGGIPGSVLDIFTQGVDLTVNGPAPTGQIFVGRDVQEWNLVLGRDIDHAGACKWYEVRNFATGDTTFWMDGDASNGNLQAAQDLNQNGVYEAPAEVVADDLYICINGGFSNNAICFADPCAGLTPANDLCQNAIALTAGTVAGTTACAGADAVQSCSGIAIAPSVWYSVTGTGNTITVDTCASANYDTTLEVYCGGCVGSVCVTGNDDFCGLQSSVSFCTAVGETYLVLVQTEAEFLADGYHRKRTGLNHLAFHAKDRAQVDWFAQEFVKRGHPLLYPDQYPPPADSDYYAVFCEDPDRIKVELVAD